MALLLRNLGITAIPLHGQMSQVNLHSKSWVLQFLEDYMKIIHLLFNLSFLKLFLNHLQKKASKIKALTIYPLGVQSKIHIVLSLKVKIEYTLVPSD